MAATDVVVWVTGAGTVVLGGVTYWYARLTRRTAIAAEASATAAAAAAGAAQKAADAAERQAAAAERAEMLASMPLPWAIWKPVGEEGGSDYSVQLGNASGGTAINVTLRIWHGPLPGPQIEIHEPLPAGPAKPLARFVVAPGRRSELGTGLFSLQIRYQDRQGRNYLAVSKANGSWDYALVDVNDRGFVDQSTWLLQDKTMRDR